MADFDWSRWAQSLSDAPAADPSLFFALLPGTSRTLDLIFSHTYVPPGKFTLLRDGKASPNWRLHLNCSGNNYYQRGIPGVAESIDRAAAWLGRVIAGLDISKVRAIGGSMGGYAALLFGHLVSADLIIAVGPEIMLGEAHDRSFIWYEEKIYDPRYREVSAVLAALGARARIVFPAYDVSDFQHIGRAQKIEGPEILYLPSFHTGGQLLDWPKILAAGCDIAFPQGFTAHPSFDLDYGPAALAEATAAFAAICERRFMEAHQRLMALCAEKPNPGLAAQAAAQLCLNGDFAAAQTQLAAAKALHRAFYAECGLAPPEMFASRLVMGAYRHVLSEEEQGALRGLLDRREG
ncbi:MAG: alpha/beta fold hydrolase [Methylovirgula sp.]